MKKLISTFGLLMLMMVVTSFTTPNEIGGGKNTPINPFNIETGGTNGGGKNTTTLPLSAEIGGKSTPIQPVYLEIGGKNTTTNI